jgi:hypothetical protein
MIFVYNRSRFLRIFYRFVSDKDHKGVLTSVLRACAPIESKKTSYVIEAFSRSGPMCILTGSHATAVVTYNLKTRTFYLGDSASSPAMSLHKWNRMRLLTTSTLTAQYMNSQANTPLRNFVVVFIEAPNRAALTPTQSVTSAKGSFLCFFLSFACPHPGAAKKRVSGYGVGFGKAVPGAKALAIAAWEENRGVCANTHTTSLLEGEHPAQRYGAFECPLTSIADFPEYLFRK